ncbi:MAG: aminomethyl-transferring glycine dehydrogenase subunit GcvPB [Candidatus Sumerlaeia bacterium]|nr:aminomethyl-transferring glycine dehydrogenase subunit GcvPB [Candidatus Sumerlaeia bacterium]
MNTQGRLPLIYDRGQSGRRGVMPPAADAAERRSALAGIPKALRRTAPAPLPEVSELDTVRHFTRLSQRNYSIDGQMYPLGSCTMKYNPKFNDRMASLPGFSELHPMQEDADIQGMLGVYWHLQELLKHVLGLPGVTLAPAAGAQGEFAGMATIRAYHKAHSPHRDVVLVPDQAHGTNPASAVLAGFGVREIKSGPDGRVSMENLKAAIDDRTAAIMLTNPNTCGIFEKDILEISTVLHEAGALLYYDGANLNAIVGRARPGDMGFDAVHMNLHKTFSTPHGGGGPGAGPVGVSEKLVPYLPDPRITRNRDGSYHLSAPGESADSIGKMMAFHGNAGVLVRALAYGWMQGGKGLRDVANLATLNANYVLAKLDPETYEQPYAKPCKHEALVTVRHAMKDHGIKAFDVAKRLLDLGFHAPTMYFPLVVPECLLIEPTETESKETLDQFIAAMNRIAREIKESPDLLHAAPTTTPTGRLNEADAARKLSVCCDWTFEPVPEVAAKG